MKYIFWIGIFPFLFAWLIHFNIILIIMSLGYSPSSYDKGLAGALWVLLYGAALVLSILVFYSIEKEKEKNTKV